MADKFTPKKRSEIMRQIRGKHTAPEMVIRRLLHRLGYRARLHKKELPGRPDIVLPRYRTVVFMHGCFWHGHPGCKRATTPATRTEFWRNKIAKNRARDERVRAVLAELGYRVIVVWECELKNQTEVARMLETVIQRG